MILKRALIAIFLFSNHLFAQDGIIIEKTPLVIGETIYLESKILNETRTINIYLPEGYQNDSLKKYPVIYLLDGSLNEDFIHISGLVQFGSFSWINMVPKSIVVGIANTDRKRDFTFPTNNKKDQKDFPTAGKSTQFISFIEKELQPLIDKHYKADSIKTIIGQSLGGLIATEILFERPDLFNHYIIVSPSLWWDDESFLKKKFQDNTSKKTIYIAVGKEGEIMERTANELFEKVDTQKKMNTKVYFDFFEKKNHGDALHMAVYNAFEKIFK